MGLVKRLMGGRQQEAPPPGGPRWFDYPDRGDVRLASVSLHLDAYQRLFRLGQTASRVNHLEQAELLREPGNEHDPYAVKVLVRGESLGYLPADLAVAWSPYLARMEADGYRVRVTIEISGSISGAADRPYIEARLRIGWKAPLMPAELAAERARAEQREAERVAAKAQREAERVERVERPEHAALDAEFDGDERSGPAGRYDLQARPMGARSA